MRKVMFCSLKSHWNRFEMNEVRFEKTDNIVQFSDKTMFLWAAWELSFPKNCVDNSKDLDLDLDLNPW